MDRVLRPVTVLLAMVVLLVSGLRLTGHPVPMVVQLIPFAVSILVFGLPHGALDHLVPARLNPGISTIRSVLAVVLVYLVVGGATGLLWHTAPTVGFTLFIAVTWFHWGQGDLYIDHLLDTGPVSRVDAILTVALRGAIPMLIPLVFFPADYTGVIQQTVRAISPNSTIDPDLLTGPALRIGVLTAVVVLAVAQLTVRYLRRRPVRRQIVETGVLLALFATTPPVLAVGLYFTLWHAVRHILRLELTDPAAAVQLREGHLAGPFLRFLRDAWPTTFAAILLLATLAIVLQTADLGTYLVFIAALTTPHTVIVTWMDRRQQTWQAIDARMPAEHGAHR